MNTIYIYIYRLIKLSSTKLNYLTIGGGLLLYLDVIIYIIPFTDARAVNVDCHFRPALTALGFSFCYGTVVVKMARVYYIFHNPSTSKKVQIFNIVKRVLQDFLVNSREQVKSDLMQFMKFQLVLKKCLTLKQLLVAILQKCHLWVNLRVVLSFHCLKSADSFKNMHLTCKFQYHNCTCPIIKIEPLIVNSLASKKPLYSKLSAYSFQ